MLETLKASMLLLVVYLVLLLQGCAAQQATTIAPLPAKALVEAATNQNLADQVDGQVTRDSLGNQPPESLMNGIIRLDDPRKGSVGNAPHLQPYILTLNTEGNGQITKSPDQLNYAANTTVDLEAIPDPGWRFVRWSGDLDIANNTISVIMTRNLTLKAHFEPAYTLTITISGNGNVLRNPNKTAYLPNEGVTLTAQPAPNWRFVRWEGAISNPNSPVNLTMDANKQVTAVFEPIPGPYTLVTNVSGSGTVTKTPDQGDYLNGTTVTLQAFPSPGWRFVGWEGDLSGNASPVLITMDRNKVIRAVFEVDSGQYRLTVDVRGNGTVTKNPDNTFYAPGSIVTLTAVPGSGASFQNWGGDASGNATSITITMDRDKTVTAYFDIVDPIGGCTYIVQYGDWIYQIARRFNTSAESIIRANDLPDPHYIQPGQCLVIPQDGNPPGHYRPKPKPHKPGKPYYPGGCDYKVQYGDWLYQIARRFGVSPQKLIYVNNLPYPHNVYPGQCLIIPKGY